MLLIVPAATLLLATLGLVFRFIIHVTVKTRTTYATISQFAFVAYFAFNNEWFWTAVWVALIYRELRKSPRNSDPNLLVLNAILLYGLGTMWLLDLMGLSRIYKNPFVLLSATLVFVVGLVWWTIADSKKMDAASPQNR
jgi:hypothetical protein